MLICHQPDTVKASKAANRTDSNERKITYSHHPFVIYQLLQKGKHTLLHQLSNTKSYFYNKGIKFTTRF